jgi:hypothetical protein
MKNSTNQFVLKKAGYSFIAALILIIISISCSSSDNGNGIPTATRFNNLKTKAIQSITQHFQFNTADGFSSFVSAKNVIISVNASSLTLNGNPVTGQIDIEYVEIFDGGTMLATGKHTMGLMPDGKHAVMNSGGEFYINATKNGQQLELSSVISLQIPTNLTDNVGGNAEMTLWNFAEVDTVWVPLPLEQIAIGGAGVFLNNIGGVPGEASSYYAYLNHFGWTNVDCFYNDPRPRTTILASVPNGYNDQNSSVYLHYDGQGNALALLDIYDSGTGLFSEHYGQIPIGLACHIIFVTEDNGKWRYAIKAKTIAAGDIYDFTFAETTLGTNSQMIAAIDALP